MLPSRSEFLFVFFRPKLISHFVAGAATMGQTGEKEKANYIQVNYNDLAFVSDYYVQVVP